MNFNKNRKNKNNYYILHSRFVTDFHYIKQKLHYYYFYLLFKRLLRFFIFYKLTNF